MTKPFLLLRSIPQRRLLPLTLLTCTLTIGCQTPGLSTALSKEKADAQTVSSTASAETKEAGLPEPTNRATSNTPLSLSSIDEHLRLGEEELGRGNYQQARMHFEHVLEKHPDHSKAHHRLGVLADKLSQFERAEQHYLTALAGDSRNAALLSDLGYSYFMQGRHADAERYLLESRKVDPQYDTAIANLGLLYGSTGRKQEALALFRQIGDDEQVQAIMEQINGGSFGPSGALAADTPVGQQSSAVTTQASVQQSAAGSSQGLHHDPTQDFAEQLRRAREELRRVEDEFFRHQQAQQSQQLQNGQPAQPASRQQSQQSTLAQQASPSQQPPQWQNQQMPGQAGPSTGEAVRSGALADRNPSSHPAAMHNAPAAFGPQDTVAPLPEVIPGARNGTWQTETTPTRSQQASAAAAGQAPANGDGTSYQSDPSASSFASQPSGLGQPPWEQTPAAMQAQQAASQNAFAASGTPQTSRPPTAWGQEYATSIEQAGEQTTPNSPQAIQQLSGNAPSPGQQRPVEHAFHTQQPHNSHNNIALASGQDAAWATSDDALPQINSQPRNSQSSNAGSGNPTAPRSNAFDEARRQAALLGLNAGPGQVFPHIQRYERVRTGAGSPPGGPQHPASQPHAAPGAMSSDNSSARFSQQYRHGSSQQASPQQLSSQSWQQQPQLSQQQPQWQQQSTTDRSHGGPVPPSGQSSDEHAQAWGQQQSAPYGVSSSTTTQNYGPSAAPAPQYSQPSQVTPLPYYQRQTDGFQQGAVQTGYQSPQPAPRSAPQQASGGVVVPEAYPHRQPITPGRYEHQQPQHGQPQQYHQQPQRSQHQYRQQQPGQYQSQQPTPRPYAGPTIVPGER